MSKSIAILHYSAPPVVGGVEAVIEAHARLLVRAGYQVTVVAGRGQGNALPDGTRFEQIPEIDSQHPEILQISQELEKGRVPEAFETMEFLLEAALRPVLGSVDTVIIHNIFTKHFNLPLTAALMRLLDKKAMRACIAWCHDFTWTSEHSRFKVHPGAPWDDLRTFRPEVTYVTVSQMRQRELARLLGVAREKIKVIYNGVDPARLLGLSQQGQVLLDGLGIWDSDLVMLMPVRITQAKNIETAILVSAALKKAGIRATLVISGPPDPHDPANMDYYQGLLGMRHQARLEKEVRFIYEGAARMTLPLVVDEGIIGELYRASDLLLLPSHREGFGMPVLEAGLSGLPVFSTRIPAAEEIGGNEVVSFPADTPAEKIAGLIMDWAKNSSTYKLRRRVRREYTWQAIFEKQIEPLLSDSEAG